MSSWIKKTAFEKIILIIKIKINLLRDLFTMFFLVFWKQFNDILTKNREHFKKKDFEKFTATNP